MGAGRGERGQATVELALTLPLVILLCLIVIQAGLVAKDALLVQHAAREAARAAAVEPNPTVALRAALASARLAPERLSLTLGGGTTRGETTTARLRYRSPTDVPLVGRLVGDVTLGAEVTMRVE